MCCIARSVLTVAYCITASSAGAQQPSIADSTLDAASAHLRYRLAGRGTPVVLVHGFAGGANDLAGLRTALASSHLTISVEIRGFGETTGAISSSGADTSIVEDIARIMAHLHINRADFVGFSMGAVLATRLAILHPYLVRSLLLVSAAPMLVGTAQTFWDPIADDLARGRGIPTLIRATTPVGTSAPSDSVIAAISQQVIGAHDSRAWASVARGMPSLSFAATELRTIRVPVLVVYGANDPLMPGHGAWATELRSVEIDTVANANHASARQVPEFIRLAQRFLQTAGAP